MSNLEFTFEESVLDLFPEAPMSGFVSAVRFLAVMEEKSEEAVEDALLELENSGIVLDISDLPKVSGTGEAAVRLRREAELVKNNTLLTALKKTIPCGCIWKSWLLSLLAAMHSFWHRNVPQARQCRSSF